MQRRHSICAKPPLAFKAVTPPVKATDVRIKVEHEDVKPTIKRERSTTPKSQRARSLSIVPHRVGRNRSSAGEGIRELLSRRRRVSTTPARYRSLSTRRGNSILSTTSSMTSSGLRFDRPPTRDAQRSDLQDQANSENSTGEGDDDDDDDDDVIEVPTPQKVKTKGARESSASGPEDYVTFTLRLEAPSVFPWPQTVSFTAPRLNDWTVAGLQNQRQLKRCSRILQENILNLYQTQ